MLLQIITRKTTPMTLFKSLKNMKYITYFLLTLFVIAQFSCDLEDPLADLDCDEIIMLSSTPSSGTLADGKSVIVFTATLGEDVKPNQAITFRTDYGFFVGTGQLKELTVTSTEKKAIAQLVVTNIITDFEVSAQLETSCQQFISMSTVASLPQFIDLQSDKSFIKADRSEEAMLTVALFRNTGAGTTSEGIRVTFDQDANNTEAEADLPDFAFSTDGKVMVGLRSATDSTGVVTITANVESADGGVVSESLNIEFVEQ